MRRLIAFIFMIMIGLVPVMAETVYTIDTEYGQEQVVVPDGYTDTDVLLIVAKAYYEQTHEIEELKSQIENLTESSDNYISENKALRLKYDDLIKDYDVLVKRLEQRNMLSWIKGYAGLMYSPYKDNPGIGLDAGVLLFSTVLVKASANYFMSDGSLCIGIGAGFLF